MQVRRVAALGLLVLPLLGVAVHARAEGKPEVQLSMTAEKEVTVKEGDKQVVKRVPATTSAPGDVLIYTLRYKNVGDEKATAVKVDNPLPDGARYVADSASGAGAEISFSVDGGKTFAKPAGLMVVKGGTKVKAEVADYTTIRWVISEVGPGKSGELGFRVQVQ